GRVYSHGNVRLFVADFFTLTATDLGELASVYDRAALVAIEPSRRAEYVSRLAALLPPGAGLLLVSFEHDMPSGPPFSVPEVAELLQKDFVAERIEAHDVLEGEPRFRASGATYLREVVWYARRR